MADDIILLVEKGTSQVPTFASSLGRKGYMVEVVTTGADAHQRATEIDPVVIILNAPSLGSSGLRICRSLKDETDIPVIHILQEDSPALNSKEPPCDVMLALPFTARKLINQIKRLWPSDPSQMLVGGPITLATNARVVRAHGRETRLTPKSAYLLELFLRQPGKTLDRGYLMRKVWKTDYIGDTRTLDVHVRWVRQAVEPVPERPIYIRTVRRLGYRFVPDPEALDESVK